MWSIGDIKIDGRVVLGPMSGVTTKSYRSFMIPFGVAVAVTEMTSDQGIIHGKPKSTGYFDFTSDVPTGLQFFGNDSEDLLKASRIALEINPSIAFIDINMGCPVTKVTKKGSGSALMKDPERCGRIIRELKKGLDVPVTAKIRLGWSKDSINFMDVIEELEAAEVDAIAMHPRTKDEHYYGFPHYDLVKDLRKNMSVPLIISGNIYSADDAFNALEITGAEAVMVARGGVGNPYMITQIDRYLRTGEKLINPTVNQQTDWCLELADMVIDEMGEDAGMRMMRHIAPKFISGCYQSRRYRNIIGANSVDRDGLNDMMAELKATKGHERIFSWGKHLEEITEEDDGYAE